jgi:biopolymer transport protein ExbD
MKERRGFESLNVIPMIDVMLVLLTIVLTTASFIATGRIPVKLPEASAEPAQERQTEVVEIDAAGGIHYDGEAVTLDALRDRLERLDRETPVLMRADKTIPFQRAVDVLDLLKRMAFRHLAIQTDKRDPPRPGADGADGADG